MVKNLLFFCKEKKGKRKIVRNSRTILLVYEISKILIFFKNRFLCILHGHCSIIK